MAPEIYHVFLSFRGHTRKTLAYPISEALKGAGFCTFMDENDIHTGEVIDSTISDGINHSVSAIIIFSEDYATSRWCLDELVLILKRRENAYFPIIPIYCSGVRSGDVKLQDGSRYLKALEKHKKRHGDDKVEKWKAAIMEVGGCKGVRAEGRLDKFVKKIVLEIKVKISPTFVKMNPPLVKEPLLPKRRPRNLFPEILQDIRDNRNQRVKALHPSEIDVVGIHPHFEWIGESDHDQQENQATYIEAMNENAHEEHDENKLSLQDPYTKDENQLSNNCWGCGLGPLCIFLWSAHSNFVDYLHHKLQGV